MQEVREEALTAADGVRPGRYRHYKGNLYEVIGVARHSETEEPMVVYRCLYGDRSLWVRPLAMFSERVVVEGREVPRFERCGE
jgi:hypothetical protein